MLEQTMLPNWLEKRAELSPDRLALKYKNSTYTFKQLYDLSVDFSSKLYATGIRKEQRVGVLQNNSFEMVLTIHALMNLGVEIILLNTRLTSNELLWQIKDAEIQQIITEKAFREVKNKVSFLSFVFVEDIPSMACSTEFKMVREFNLSKTATIMYTSGTTGFPKGVMQTYGNHWWSAVGSMLNLGLEEKDIWLCTVPLFHISGLSILIRSVIYGMTVILHDQFNELDVNDAIKNEKITIMSVVTAMLNRMLLQLGDRRYPAHFRCMLLGGGPAPKKILEVCKDKGVPVFQTYGMTETASQIVTLAPEYSFAKLGSAGKALFPSQLKIQLKERLALPYEVGEIFVKGPNVTKGYVNRPEATEEAFEKGWLRTGDLGYLDEDNFLFVVDRRLDLIISGGENVYPAEIEAALLVHEAVFEAGVTGMKDEKWGEVPVAFVVLHKPIRDVRSLNDHCTHLLAPYKRPKKIYIVDELPRNSANKLVRRQLKTLLLECEGEDGSD